jgi:quinoprotein glucose dehydrogenase
MPHSATTKGIMRRTSKAAILLALCFLVARPFVTRGQRGAVNGEWRWYGGDAGGAKYSPLDQINAENVKQLQIAWRWKREGFGPRPDSNWQVTPLMAARCTLPLE